MKKDKKRAALIAAIAGTSVLLLAMILFLRQGDNPVEALTADTLDETICESKTVEAEKRIPPELDALFERFKGNWVFDSARGAVIYIGRFEESGWAMLPELFPNETPSWIVSVTGGDILTDCEAISWTNDSILFHKNGHYSQIRSTEFGGIEYTYGNSPDRLDDRIRSDDRRIAD